MSYKIPLDSPLLCGNEQVYLKQCVETNWLSHQGHFVEMLSDSLKKYLSVSHCVPVSSGTNAILIALQALGVGPGDEIIVPSLTMSGCITPIVLLGAKPVWIDCSEDSVNLDITSIEGKITDRTKAVLAVDLYGTPVDVRSIKGIVKHIPVIEDVAESLGAQIADETAGKHCDIAIHSFHNKIIASGEGGALTFNRSDLVEEIRQLTIPSPNNRNSDRLIMNSRMSNLSAAVAMAQFENLDYLIDRRRQIAKYYDDHIDARYKIFKQPAGQKWAYWRYQIYTSQPTKTLSALDEKGIESRPIFSPMHQHPQFKSTETLPNCERLSATGIDIPISPKMTLADASIVVDAVNAV